MFTEGIKAIIYGIATLLLYPVLVFEVVALVLVSYEAGRFTLEVARRRQARRGLDMEAVGTRVYEDSAAIVTAIGALGAGPVPSCVRRALEGGVELVRDRVLKALADGEFEANRLLERTRILIRLGPVLGLMGTLIPISPALVGLAQGDVLTLSNNLVIAFSTTVVGLLIGSVAYVLTTVRERHYRQDVSDIEYILDRAVM